MEKIRIFLSSIINGYLDRRDAAQDAILALNADEGLNLEVIRMDLNKHPAVNKSSQKACLDGVKECDIYIGIFPENDYGWDDSPIGISPTHEEFLEAIKENKPRIIFVEKTRDLSQKQKEFLYEVGKYDTGRYWNTFEERNLHQLNQLVYRSLLRFLRPKLDEYLPDYLLAYRRQLAVIGTPKGEIGSISIDKIVEPWLRIIGGIEDRNSKVDASEEKNKFLLNDAVRIHQRLFLIGPPGSGKSTSLKWIAYNYAEQIFNDPKAGIHIPVYLELKIYDNNLSELIMEAFTRSSFKGEYNDLIKWFRKGGFIFLLDGLDEIDRSLSNKFYSEINILLGFSKENNFIIASRNAEKFNDFESLGFGQSELMPLSQSYIENFIKIYIGDDNGNKMFREMKSLNLLNESKNPLMLWFMILEFMEHGVRKSLNKAMLFKSVLEDRFLKKWDKKHIPSKYNFEICSDLKIKILSEIAFHMINQNDLTVISEEKANEITDDFLKEGRANYKNIRDKILTQLFESRILIKTNSQLSFWHKSFRDYFASLILLELYNLNPINFRKLYTAKKWEDSLLFFFGLIENPSHFVDDLVPPFRKYFMKLPDKFHLSLAAKCIGANNTVNIRTQQRLQEQLIKIIEECEFSIPKPFNFRKIYYSMHYSSSDAIQALLEMKSESSSEFLLSRLEHMKVEANFDDSDFMSGSLNCRTIFGRYIFEAMKKVPVSLSQNAQNSLLNIALTEEDLYLSEEAKILLRDQMTKDIAYILCNIISNDLEKREIRKKIYKSDCGLVLEHHSIREQGIEILCGYADEPLLYPDISIGPLIKIALEENDKHLRNRGATALKHYYGKDKDLKIVKPIIHALHNNTDPIIRSNAAWALIHHPDSNLQFEALIFALDDDNVDVLSKVLHTLIYSRNHDSIDTENKAANKLLKLIVHEDDRIASKSIHVLGYVRKKLSDKDILFLTDLLKDGRPLVRYRVAELLGNCRERNSLNELKRMIESEKYLYPWAYAIRAILRKEPSYSEIVKNNGWELDFITDLHDEDINKRQTALEVLRCIGTDLSLDTLKKLEKDIENPKLAGIENKLFYAIKDIEERMKP